MGGCGDGESEACRALSAAVRRLESVVLPVGEKGRRGETWSFEEGALAWLEEGPYVPEPGMPPMAITEETFVSCLQRVVAVM